MSDCTTLVLEIHDLLQRMAAREAVLIAGSKQERGGAIETHVIRRRLENHLVAVAKNADDDDYPRPDADGAL